MTRHQYQVVSGMPLGRARPIRVNGFSDTVAPGLGTFAFDNLIWPTFDTFIWPTLRP